VKETYNAFLLLLLYLPPLISIEHISLFFCYEKKKADVSNLFLSALAFSAS